VVEQVAWLNSWNPGKGRAIGSHTADYRSDAVLMESAGTIESGCPRRSALKTPG
jgi:hypothetical protein